MKYTLVVISALILGGCAAGTTRMGGSGSSPGKSNNHSTEPGPATLLGRNGEDADHLYARLIARACAADETEHVVAQVESFIDACKSDGQRQCELAACDKLRQEMPRRCSESLARVHDAALEQLRAELDVVVRRNRP